MASDLSKYIDTSYKELLMKQINTPSLIAEIAQSQARFKENLIRECLSPMRKWLVLNIKWRKFQRFLLRSFRIEEHHSGVYKVFRGNKLLKEQQRDTINIKFVRHSKEDRP